MNRELSGLNRSDIDVLVIGGGIHGAFVALDAAQRGLSTVLVEQGDFGSATSSNSLKTVHGGLRYLQDMDVQLVQKMIFERKTYLNIAPHLVHPIPFVAPTIKKLARGRAAMSVALTLNDFFGRNRNVNQVKGKELPPSRSISKAECLDYLPGLDPASITGGALWYDAQIYNTERFLISVLKSAVKLGAQVANYVTAKNLVLQDGRVTGADIVDQLTGDELRIGAKVVVNATGAWIDRLITGSRRPLPSKLDYPLTAAWNIVTRQFIDKCAAGIFGQPKNGGKSKLLFVAPWRNYSIAGTVHETLKGTPESYRLPLEKIEAFLAEINATYRGADLTMDDVRSVHKGFHHVKSVPSQPDKEIKALRRGIVYEHVGDLDGLLTIVSVKFTTARAIAEQTADIICQKLGVDQVCQTHVTPISGGDMSDFDVFLQNSPNVKKSILYNYGSESSALLSGRYADDLFDAQVNYAIANEMVCKLSDVLLRRTDVGSGERPSAAQIGRCADLMAVGLNWSDAQKSAEIEQFNLEMNQRWSAGIETGPSIIVEPQETLG